MGDGMDFEITNLKLRESVYGLETDQGITLDDTAEDATNTPVTTLRKGLVLGKITASGKYAQYDDAAADGTEVAVGLLGDTVDLLERSADGTTPSDNQGLLVTVAEVDEGNLIGLDANGKADLVATTGLIFRNPVL